MIDHKIGEKIEPCVHGILVAGMNLCVQCEVDHAHAVQIVRKTRDMCFRHGEVQADKILTRVLRHLYGASPVIGNDGHHVQPGHSTAAFDPLRQGQ